MLKEYLTGALRRLTEEGRKPVAYPELLEAVKVDVAMALNKLYKEGAISVHGNVNGVKIITWKGGGGHGEGG